MATLTTWTLCSCRHRQPLQFWATQRRCLFRSFEGKTVGPARHPTPRSGGREAGPRANSPASPDTDGLCFLSDGSSISSVPRSELRTPAIIVSAGSLLELPIGRITIQNAALLQAPLRRIQGTPLKVITIRSWRATDIRLAYSASTAPPRWQTNEGLSTWKPVGAWWRVRQLES